MAYVESAAQRLLDFSQPVDVPLLDATVTAFYSATNPAERISAEKVLRVLQEHPDAWTRVDAILEKAQSQQAKYFALQILEDVIKHRWGALPEEQRQGIRNYISNLIIKLATTAEAYKAEKVYLGKLNLILVEILKQDWPHKWPSFIPDIVGASKTSETLCENSMQILRMLSEEIFDFSRGELTQAKTRELKGTLTSEFRLIHDLCLMVLNMSRQQSLVRATLATLAAYLSWVPLGYILESNVVEVLLALFPQPPYRNLALQCLTEIAVLQVEPEHNSHFENLYKYFITQLRNILPPGTDLNAAWTAGTDEDQALVQNLAIFFTSFYRHHISILEVGEENRAALLFGMDYLVNISFVPDEEVFKICLDYWNFLVPDIYSSVCTVEHNAAFSFGTVPSTNRKGLYSGVLSKLRTLMITRMARPEEVIVVEDENGNLVRETMKDTDTLARYKTMHETLVYLSHLDHDDTETQMLEKLRLQMQTRDWSWNTLNTLCWAIGSISGSMQEEQENRFLISVIRDLLNLCEITKGKDNKAVVASNIMYVVGQYPRFLRNHWKFLKTVVNKLFEFMHELHPGVQDMACETFLKICHKCKRKFVVIQIGETEPFISELLSQLTTIIQDLEVHQVHMFYEAVGLMIGAESEARKREEYLDRLMLPPNTTWKQLITQAQANPDVLKQPEVLKSVLNILQTNVSVCSSLGPPFQKQMMLIFEEMLTLYRLYSELISGLIATGGPHAAKTSAVKLMRSVKKVVLKLLDTFVEKHDNAAFLASSFVPLMLDPILGDYARNVPDAREAEVLSLFATVINKLKEQMEPNVPRIFEAIFECTLQMITKNFEDYPEHRLQFFSLLRAINSHCFATLFQMTPEQLKLVIDSIIWAFRHTERNVADTGLNLLQELLMQFLDSPFATQFYQTYYTRIMQEVFAVMTDTFHKPGFKTQCKILHQLCEVVQGPMLTANMTQGEKQRPAAEISLHRSVCELRDLFLQAPLWDVAAQGPTAYPNNLAFAMDFVNNLLTTSFPNLRPQQVQATVTGMFELKDFSAFKHHLRDFLIQTKQFASQDNADLFAEEVAQQREAERQKMSAIPGMLNPNDMQEEMAELA